MNYYCFVDSRDIRKHLEDIQYPLTSPEAAYLVWQCRSANLKEKKQAWEAILTTMPDCSLEGRRDMNAIPSFHQFLRHYLDVLNRQQEGFSTLLGDSLSVERQKILQAFEKMWFSFPTPFQRGDLLVQPSGPSYNQFLVLESLSTWDYNQRLERGFTSQELSDCDRTVEQLKKHGDYTDMSFLAYFLEGNILCHGNRSWYLSLERYTDPLPKTHWLLRSISDVIQKRSSFADLLKDLYAWEIDHPLPQCDWVLQSFSKETLRKMGLCEEENL